MDVKRCSSEPSQYEMILPPLTVLPFAAISTVNVYDSPIHTCAYNNDMHTACGSHTRHNALIPLRSHTVCDTRQSKSEAMVRSAE